MWREKIRHISKIREKRNRKLNLPINEKELSKFRKSVVEKFGEDVLPQQYYEFLQTVNGIEFNGLIIYGIDQSFLDFKPINQVDSFFDANEIWESIKDEDELIFFGDSDIAWYCYNVSKKKFVELDKPSGEHMETFCDFDTMLKSALSAALS
ncbi:YrhA family protein [Bacillus wiedmannii]|uniref:SMI1/KNR4 family protein n=1 Tax=Bacillus wiedmannii TaxID=1890302 RepID=A0ABD6THY5_9BACI|nr:YrhA family protein [Bacillus wiedmannii]PEO56417.1 SMI1/KNR4 family protein [Bacillus wiedmannii]PFX53104.1 SMI1/KNR4 family protein [Bacillus wiedmannii]PGC75404.1 SMI1/KNR4 family protein [Bacillus wiedmannii]PHG17720.1 SMI1/KNR4 family protein [Bacillus wiedmannii]